LPGIPLRWRSLLEPAEALPSQQVVAYAEGMINSAVLGSSIVETAERLSALADPVRLVVVGILAEGEHCVCDLNDRVPVAANLLSYHLRVLREAGLVSTVRRGRWVDYRLSAEGFTGLWGQLAAAGAPLPGQAVATGRGGPVCADHATAP
jgi:ArsR family transcriptional regulator